MGELYDQPQLFYRPESPDKAWIEIPIEVKKKEPLRLILSCTRAPDYGRYQAYLDGVKIGKPMELYSDKTDNFRVPTAGFLARTGHLHVAIGMPWARVQNRKDMGLASKA